jgi:hypothetical protein
MKNKSMVLLSLLTVSITQATYMVKVNLGDEITFYQWTNDSPLLGSWVNSGAVYDCSNWSPLVESMTTGMSFTQTATDCKQNQTQTAQDREIDTVTGTVRDIGLPYTNTQHIPASDTRLAVGTLETWIAALPEFTSWVDNGGVTNCTNWSPATSTVTINQDFTQTATDCTQAQTRSKQDREQETTTGAFRHVGAVVTESKNLVASSTRLAKGAKETWVAIASTSTAWVNNGALTGCSNWSPATSTVPANQGFTQTATDCKQPQTSTRQDREQETTTLAIRNKGVAVTENQNITTTSTRTATGTKVAQQCLYDTYNYNWSHGFAYTTTIVWAGQVLFDNSWTSELGAYSSMVIGGFKYSRGADGPDYPGMSYYICREPI